MTAQELFDKVLAGDGGPLERLCEWSAKQYIRGITSAGSSHKLSIISTLGNRNHPHTYCTECGDGQYVIDSAEEWRNTHWCRRFAYDLNAVSRLPLPSADWFLTIRIGTEYIAVELEDIAIYNVRPQHEALARLCCIYKAHQQEGV